MSLGPYADFILSAYAVSAIVLAVLIAWVMLDHRAQTRALADLDARGARRRFAAAGGENAPVQPGKRPDEAPEVTA